MLFRQNTFQATLTVCVMLVTAFVVTGFASSAYHRKRTALGVSHYDNGRTLQAKGQLEPALEEYRKALLFSPDDREYRLSLATALLEDGRLDEAQSHLEQLLAEDPTSGPINVLVGRLAVRQKRISQAIDYYQRGVYEYWPESQFGERREARWELADLLNKTGDRSGFVAELLQLYNNLPANDVYDKQKVGALLLANGATPEAARIYRELVKQAPQNVAAHRGVGEVYFNSAEYVSARHEFQRALRLDPKDADSLKMLALTNEVIDMDPVLPYITAAELFRRSENLLTRVVKDLVACSAPSGSLAQQLDEAKQLLSQGSAAPDAAFSMQKKAADLWADRGSLCTSPLAPDRPVDTVLARIGRE